MFTALSSEAANWLNTLMQHEYLIVSADEIGISELLELGYISVDGRFNNTVTAVFVNARGFHWHKNVYQMNKTEQVKAFNRPFKQDFDILEKFGIGVK